MADVWWLAGVLALVFASGFAWGFSVRLYEARRNQGTNTHTLGPADE